MMNTVIYHDQENLSHKNILFNPDKTDESINNGTGPESSKFW